LKFIQNKGIYTFRNGLIPNSNYYRKEH